MTDETVKRVGDEIREALMTRTIPPGPFGAPGLGLTEYDLAQVAIDALGYDEKIKAIVEKFGDEELQKIHDCCGCSMPWDLYDKLLAAVSAIATKVEPTPTPQEPS